MDSFDFETNLLGVWNDEDDNTSTNGNGEESALTSSRRHSLSNEVNDVGVMNNNSLNHPWNNSSLDMMNGFNVLGDTSNNGVSPNTSGHQVLDQNDATTNQSGGQNFLSSDMRFFTHMQGGRDGTNMPAENMAAISETTSIQDEDRSSATRSSGSSSRTPNSSNQTTSSAHHPLAIQSSASCPPPSHSTGAPQPAHGTSLMQPPSSSSDLYSADLSQALEQSNFGLMAVVPTPPPLGPPTGSAASNQIDSTHLSMLANNFLMAAATTGPSMSSQTSDSNSSYPMPPDPGHVFPSPAVAATSAMGGAKNASSNRNNKKNNNPVAGSSSLPPFFLFDAPVELRANFMQNQRKLGLPIEHDPNSFHYGETVNGYHPQQLLKAGTALSAQEAAALLHVGVDPTQVGVAASLHHRHLNGHHNHYHRIPVQMIDARHSSNSHRRNRNGQIKNEREQKRAQKITELIEQIRGQIESDGWHVEGRSKFNTLSKCADYVKHMLKTTAEKEQELKKLKCELEVKKRKVEDKAVQESRSDPESVTSSLTSNTSSGSRRSEDSRSRTERSDDVDYEKKRKVSGSYDGQESSASGSPGQHKKQRVEAFVAATEDSSGEARSGTGSGSRSVSMSGSGSGSGSGGSPSAQGNSMTKTVSTVSDLTDSNPGSSSNNTESATASGETDACPEKPGEAGEQRSTSSISSDAAVASEKTGHERHSGHKDVVFKNDNRGRKRPPEEVTSLERNFEVNYEEVFDKSNIPQIIASTSGKIITWNECFVKASGYRRTEIERLTIFSLVRPDKLANFFDIVAAALRPDEDVEKTTGKQQDSEKAVSVSEEDSKDGTEEAEGSQESVEKIKSSNESKVSSLVKEDNLKTAMAQLPSRLLDYNAITLPCIDFPGMKKRKDFMKVGDYVIDPLTITVTLMTDKDSRRRYFHCVFTNCRGTNGALGALTPELLASLFSKPLRRRKKHHHQSSRRKHKHSRRQLLTHDQADKETSDDEAGATTSCPEPPSMIGGSATEQQEVEPSQMEDEKEHQTSKF